MEYRCQSSKKGAYGDNIEGTRCAYIQGKVHCKECDAVLSQQQPALSD